MGMICPKCGKDHGMLDFENDKIIRRLENMHMIALYYIIRYFFVHYGINFFEAMDIIDKAEVACKDICTDYDEFVVDLMKLLDCDEKKAIKYLNLSMDLMKSLDCDEKKGIQYLNSVLGLILENKKILSGPDLENKKIL